MRRFLNLLVLPVLGLPAFSMMVANAPAVSASAWAADQPQPDAAHVRPARKNWRRTFAAANVSHDGHLTQDEAKAGYPAVAKHFDDIDADHKGYVTEKDIKAWRVMRKAARRLARKPEDKLRPRSAIQHVYPDARPAPLPRKQTLAASNGFPPA